MDQKQQYLIACCKIRQQNDQNLQQYKSEISNQTSQFFKQEKSCLEQKLQKHRDDLITEIKNLQSNIQEHHKIDNTLWGSCIKTILEILEQNRKIKHLPLQDTYHDQTLQKNIVEFIAKRLQERGINPHRITICKKKENKDIPLLYHVKNPIPHIYATSSFTDKIITNDNTLVKVRQHHRKHTKIIINEDNFLRLPQHHQFAICACIATEISQGFSIVPHVIAELEPLIETKSLTDSPQFIALQDICTKKLPIFVSCLNDPIVASSMLQLIPQYYRNNFTTQDYKLVSKISLAWNMLISVNTFKMINEM